MTFPSIISLTGGKTPGTNQSTWDIVIPSCPAGSTILVFASSDANAELLVDTGVSGSGWSIIQRANVFSHLASKIFRKTATGGGSDTLRLTVPSPGPEQGSWIVLVTDADSLYLAEFHGSSSNPDSPTVNPGIGTQDFLVLSVLSEDDVTIPTAGPTGYSTPFIVQGDASGASTTIAYAFLAVDSANPPAYTVVLDQWIAWTVMLTKTPGASVTVTGQSSLVARALRTLRRVVSVTTLASVSASPKAPLTRQIDIAAGGSVSVGRDLVSSSAILDEQSRAILDDARNSVDGTSIATVVSQVSIVSAGIISARGVRTLVRAASVVSISVADVIFRTIVGRPAAVLAVSSVSAAYRKDLSRSVTFTGVSDTQAGATVAGDILRSSDILSVSLLSVDPHVVRLRSAGVAGALSLSALFRKDHTRRLNLFAGLTVDARGHRTLRRAADVTAGVSAVSALAEIVRTRSAVALGVSAVTALRRIILRRRVSLDTHSSVGILSDRTLLRSTSVTGVGRLVASPAPQFASSRRYAKLADFQNTSEIRILSHG